MSPVRVEGKEVLERAVGLPEGHEIWFFWCDRCGMRHAIHTKPKERGWTWNGDRVRPTVRPSLLTTVPGVGQCHLFITDGQARHTDGAVFDLRPADEFDKEDDEGSVTMFGR